MGGLMKLLYFNDFRLGLYRDGQVFDVTSVVSDIPHIRPDDLMIELIKVFPEYRDKLLEAAFKAEGYNYDRVH